MNRLVVLAVLAAFLYPASSHAEQDKPRMMTLDENVWVLFYDLPSRRFQRSRDAFVRRDWESVRTDLTVSAGFIRAEISRTDDALAEPLSETADRLTRIAENIESSEFSGNDLDAVFARSHWLLAQHYLELSVAARDAGDSRNAGWYLWATAHHLERTVLWSNVRLSARQVRLLDKLRDLADRLRDAKDPAQVYKQRPVALARETLLELGKSLNRKVWLDMP